MVNIEIGKIPGTKIRLVPVASELLETDAIAGIKTIKCNNETFKVHEFYTQRKDEYFQTALFLLALGKDVEPKDIWHKYAKSDTIYLFVAELV